MEKFDVIIIGAGQAGNPLSSAFAEAGKRTALIEEKYVGGTCINYGCTPTKTMIASAEVAYMARRSEEYGVHLEDVAGRFETSPAAKRGSGDQFSRRQRAAHCCSWCKPDLW